MAHNSCAPEEFLRLFVILLLAKLSYCRHHYLNVGLVEKKISQSVLN